MNTLNLRTTVAVFALGALALVAIVATEIQAQAPAVDPAATGILKRMTDYVGSLKKFSVHTQNTIEDELESGHRVDFDVSADVIVSRPNKICSRAQGRPDRPGVLLQRQNADVVQSVRQGLRNGIRTRYHRGDARLRARVARARPSRSLTWSTATPSRC